MLGHFLWTLFYWPNGVVLGNLIASAIWGIPSAIVAVVAFVRLHRKIDRHHQWHVDQNKEST